MNVRHRAANFGISFIILDIRAGPSSCRTCSDLRSKLGGSPIGCESASREDGRFMSLRALPLSEDCLAQVHHSNMVTNIEAALFKSCCNCTTSSLIQFSLRSTYTSEKKSITLSNHLLLRHIPQARRIPQPSSSPNINFSDFPPPTADAGSFSPEGVLATTTAEPGIEGVEVAGGTS